MGLHVFGYMAKGAWIMPGVCTADREAAAYILSFLYAACLHVSLHVDVPTPVLARTMPEEGSFYSLPPSAFSTSLLASSWKTLSMQQNRTWSFRQAVVKILI